ncbi:MAG: hypothetical protein JWO56_1590, partial [Acidobacteria bacterium]|nr:hypothetical protein [Acidobacteriota bacterium]
SIVASVSALWFHIYPSVTPPRPPSESTLRLALFVVAALLIAAISRRKEEDILEAEAIYKSLVGLSPDGILCATTDGTILFANQAAVRFLGATAAGDVIGKKALEVVHPDSHELLRRRMYETPAGRVASWMEEKWRRLDGGTIFVEVAAVSVRKHHRIAWMIFARDLTERRKAEKEISEGHGRFRALFENSTDAILFANDSGHYIDANASAATILGYSREEILTKCVGDFMAPQMKAEGIARIAAGGSGEWMIQRKSGELRNIEYRIDVNIIPGTHCIFVVDVTDRKALERTSQQLSVRLLESQDEERRRIARQLHETTAQTLAALRMILVNMRDAKAPDAAARLLPESIALTEQGIREVRTLSHLLHPPLIEELGITAALRWYVDGFSERSGIAVELDAPEDIGRFADSVENSIFRIVQEALTNIHRHSGSSVARVVLAKGADELRVAIEDRGKGMPVGRSGGMPAPPGVGIAAMKERVNDLGGRLDFHSAGSGTRIVITIPLSGSNLWQSSASSSPTTTP